MVERRMPPKDKSKGGGLYFSKPGAAYTFFSTGNVLLDQVIGGGLPLGRVSNIIGDASAGKSLIATESSVSFCNRFPKGLPFYRESEAAFEVDYAEALGANLDRIDFGPDGIDTLWDTIEDVFIDMGDKFKEVMDSNNDKLNKRLEKLHTKLFNCNSKRDRRELQEEIKGFEADLVAAFYVVDSLDALSDRAEQKRKIDEGSYAMEKQKKLHQLFRRYVRKIKGSNMHVMFISQTRDKIGVSFGEKTTVNGDGSLKFYASQRVKLARLEQIRKEVRGIKYTTGIKIKARCTKNKIGLPHRVCDFAIKFGFGMNDAAACLHFLIESKMVDGLGLSLEKAKKLEKFLDRLDQEAHEEWGTVIRDELVKVWPEIQSETLPTWSKY